MASEQTNTSNRKGDNFPVNIQESEKLAKKTGNKFQIFCMLLIIL